MSLKIKQLKLSKYWPKLIIIEGFWSVGKSMLIKKLAEFKNINIIDEPNYFNNKVVQEPHKWYLNEHLKRHDFARDLVRRRKTVIMERSILSNVAFDYAKNGKLSNRYIDIIKRLPELKQCLIIFLYADKNFVENVAWNLEDNAVRNNLLKDKSFYQNYLNFYRDIFGKVIKNKFFCINVISSGKFLTPNDLISTFKAKLEQFNNKNKIKEICVSAILVYKNRFLLLYDHNWNHYVLPQGHRESGEKLTQTVLREVREETGYIDLKIIKKLKRYQYHYHQNNEIIYKIIHPYLTEILSSIKTEKRPEKHENYSNCFFNFKNAIKVVRWPQDKNLIILSQRILLRRKRAH